MQEVLDAGVIDAVDVWGYAEQDYEVCFAAVGDLLFLDAATSPRQVSSLPADHRDGMTCVSINRAGTIVLVASSANALDSVEQERELEVCEVTTNYILNFRASPGGERILALIPYRTTLAASARTAEWFQVTYLGAVGWISAAHVSMQGACR